MTAELNHTIVRPRATSIATRDRGERKLAGIDFSFTAGAPGPTSP